MSDVPTDIELAAELRRAIHLESAAIAPRTSQFIEVVRRVAESLESRNGQGNAGPPPAGHKS